MKLWVFTGYDEEGGSTLEYATSEAEAEKIKAEVEKEYDYCLVNTYESVLDFIKNSEEYTSDGFSDGECLDFVLEVLNNLGV